MPRCRGKIESFIASSTLCKTRLSLFSCWFYYFTNSNRIIVESTEQSTRINRWHVKQKRLCSQDSQMRNVKKRRNLCRLGGEKRAKSPKTGFAASVIILQWELKRTLIITNSFHCISLQCFENTSLCQIFGKVSSH